MGKKTSNTNSQPKNLEGGRRTNVQLNLETGAFIKLNIFLIALLAVLYFCTQWLEENKPTGPLSMREKIEQSKKNLQIIQKQCPTAIQNYQVCLQKLNVCIKTDSQFKKANSQIISAVDECQKINTQNVLLNERLEQQILQMDRALDQFN